MAQTPEDIETVLDQLRAVLMRWAYDDTLGEIVIVRGSNQSQIEERPIRRHEPVKRARRGQSAVTIT
jgi:hypothetical protein